MGAAHCPSVPSTLLTSLFSSVFLILHSATLLSLHLPSSHASAYIFPTACNTSQTIDPTASGSVSNPSKPPPLCPVCCKQPLNLVFSSLVSPSLSFPRVTSADRCIFLCADYAFFAITTGKVCQCYDHCSEEEQSQDPNPTDVLALGNVTACLTPCFPPTSNADVTPCSTCPLDASCVPGPVGSNSFRCCCNPLYGNPTLLPDNSSACIPFALGDDLFGVVNFASNTAAAAPAPAPGPAPARAPAAA